jgi:hypothetical protein
MAYKECRKDHYRYRSAFSEGTDNQRGDLEELIAEMDDKLDVIMDLLKPKKKT